MARRVYNFENPDRFVAGTVGQPGSRTFYLQAREGTGSSPSRSRRSRSRCWPSA